jgi:NAD(P)-dependent dehydrogenase (short-subunit alcohol dehydrogenase family)
MQKLSGRVALVTGGARGIGAASARALAEAGAVVVVGDLLEAEGGQLVETLVAAGAQAHFLRHDVREESSWQAVVQAIEERWGGLDILLNNAGVFLFKLLTETSLEEFRALQAVNVEGVFLGLKTALPAMAKRAPLWAGGGSIINVSSVMGLVGHSHVVPYNASKGAVRLMTKGAALECAHLGLKVRVNSLHPGIVETQIAGQIVKAMVDEGWGDSPEIEALTARMHPLGRLALPTEIAAAVVFLASDDAAFMTGSELVVDGGLSAQ